MSQKCMEWFRLLSDHLAWIEHEFLIGIRDSRKAGSLWGMVRGVGGVRKSIDQSWLVKGLGLGLLCWDLKGVQEEIRSEEASTLQIGSVAFPTGQCTSPQLFLSFPKLRGCHYNTTELMKVALTKVIDTLTQEDFYGAFQNVLERYKKVHCNRRRLLRRGLEFPVCTINKSADTKKVWKLI